MKGLKSLFFFTIIAIVAAGLGCSEDNVVGSSPFRIITGVGDIPVDSGIILEVGGGKDPIYWTFSSNLSPREGSQGRKIDLIGIAVGPAWAEAHDGNGKTVKANFNVTP